MPGESYCGQGLSVNRRANASDQRDEPGVPLSDRAVMNTGVHGHAPPYQSSRGSPWVTEWSRAGRVVSQGAWACILIPVKPGKPPGW